MVRPEAGDHLLPGKGDKLVLRELPSGSVLIPPLRAQWNVPLHGPEEEPGSPDSDLTTPRVYLLGLDGRLSMPPPP